MLILPLFIWTLYLTISPSPFVFTFRSVPLIMLNLRYSNEPSNTRNVMFQANDGKCNISKPSEFNFVAKAKYDAWNSLGDMSQDDAKEAYIEYVNELVDGSK